MGVSFPLWSPLHIHTHMSPSHAAMENVNFIDLTERETAPLRFGITDEEAVRDYRLYPHILPQGDLGLDLVMEEYVTPAPDPQELEFSEEDLLHEDDVVSIGSDLSDLSISTDSTGLSDLSSGHRGPDSCRVNIMEKFAPRKSCCRQSACECCMVRTSGVYA